MDTDKITEKIYCSGHPNDNSAMWAALMANKGNGNEWMYANQMNNPMWLVWMMAMRYMYGNGDGYGTNAQISQLQGQVADNQSFNSMLNAINQNQNVLNDIATRTSTSIDFVRQSLCSLNSAIQNVAGKTELSAEKVSNAVAMGDANIISQMLQCCCQNKMLVQEMGYKNELANERQTNVINAQITDTRQAIVNGFANLGYTMAQQSCDIKTNGDHNTQRIIDTLNSHWNQELQLKYQDAKLELSQQAQNAYLVSQLKTT